MTMITDESKRLRRGPIPLDAVEKREHTVSVRLNVAELARLDLLRDRVAMKRGEYLRAAALHLLPPIIPEINQEAWVSLARVVGNLNQYQAAINEGRASGHSSEVLAELSDLVQGLRRDLLGMRSADQDEEDES